MRYILQYWSRLRVNSKIFICKKWPLITMLLVFIAAAVSAQSYVPDLISTRAYEQTTIHRVHYDELVNFDELVPGEYLELLTREREIIEVTEGWDSNGAFWRITDYFTPMANVPDYMQVATMSIASAQSTSYYGAGNELLFEVSNSGPMMESFSARASDYENGILFETVEIREFDDSDVLIAQESGAAVSYSSTGAPIINYDGISLSTHYNGKLVVESFETGEQTSGEVILTSFEEIENGKGRFSYSLHVVPGETSTGYCYESVTLTVRKYLSDNSNISERQSTQGKSFKWLQVAKSDVPIVKLIAHNENHKESHALSSQEVKYSVVSTNGRIVIREASAMMGQIIKLPQLSSGVYVLQGYSDGILTTELLIVP